MEEVLHFNVTETPSSKIENGSTPSTPTDLQEIHFWQRHFQDCHRTFRVCVPAFPECVNTVINELELLHFYSACAFSVCLGVAHLVFQCRTCKSIACGFLSLKSVHRHLWHDVLSKDCVCSVNGISAYRRKKDLLQQKANIANPTNPLAWTGLFCTCLRCLVFADPRAKKCGQFIYAPWNAFN